jgi:hypothetical protein
MCGHELDLETLKSQGRILKSTDICSCKKCKRQAHRECVDKQFLVRSAFICSNISRFLGKDAIELQPKTVILAKPIREDMKCLICGDACYGADQDRLNCDVKGCCYGVHESCAAILSRVNGGLLDAAIFNCNQVNYYLKPAEVRGLVLNDVPSEWDEIKLILRARGTIRHEKYTPKRKRYENPDIECNKCGEKVNINEPDHELAYCNARYAGTPVPTRDYEYVMHKAKRLRRLTLGNYPP